MNETSAKIWIQACAHCLQLHWRTVDPAQLEEVATELLGDDRLQPMTPEEAATFWLWPVLAADAGVDDRASGAGMCPPPVNKQRGKAQSGAQNTIAERHEQ